VKRSREDDIPKNASPGAKRDFGHLQALQDHLRCQAHSKGGLVTYCHVDLAAADNEDGGHTEIDNKEMTLWAKHIVSNAYQP